MITALEKGKQREIGGILMAEQIGPGDFRIIDFSIDDITGSAAHFVRSADHHRATLDSFFMRTGYDYNKYNYLGEWHSHPNHAPFPSATDISAMRDLLNEEKNIPFAVLLIVKRCRSNQLVCSAMLFNQGEKPSLIQVTSDS